MGRRLLGLLLCVCLVGAVPTKGLQGDREDFWTQREEPRGEDSPFLPQDAEDADESLIADPTESGDASSFFAEEPHSPRSSAVQATQVAAAQEESGFVVVSVVCAASFFSVYVIHRLFGARKPRRQAHEMRTYNRIE